MSLLAFILILVLIGIALAVVNKFAAPYMDGRILTILNWSVVIGTILWVLSVLGVLPALDSVRIGHLTGP